MSTDLDFFGVFIPPMVVVAAIAFAIWLVVRRTIALRGWYQFVALRNLFDISLYFVIMTGLLIAFGGKTTTSLLW